jgi:hypothetical protein
MLWQALRHQYETCWSPGMSSRSAVAWQTGADGRTSDPGVDVSGDDDEREGGAEVTPADAEPRTVVAEPVVIDLRDGVDTVAAYEAEQADQAERAARARRG